MGPPPTSEERAERAAELVTPVVRALLLTGTLTLCLWAAGLPPDWVLTALAILGPWAAYITFVTVLRQLLAPRDARFRVLDLGPEASVNVFVLLRRLALYSAALLPPRWALSLLDYSHQDVIALLSVLHVAGLGLIALWTVYLRGGPAAFLPPHDIRSLRVLRHVAVVTFPLLGLTVLSIAVVEALGYVNLAAYAQHGLLFGILVVVVGLVADSVAADWIALGAAGGKWVRAGIWVLALAAQAWVWRLRHYHWLALVSFLNKPLVVVGQSNISPMSILRAILVVAVTYGLARLLRHWIRHSAFVSRFYDEGVRYALSGLSFYTLLALGVLWALLAGGFPLNALTVFAGMAGVGLGLGLQDIVRNFVAGLVLLIERPVALGDVVTVEGTRGEVVAIRLRSTIIRTVTNSRLVMPNSVLISQQVTNLSQQDPKVRVTVAVSVSYNSDVDQVRQVLLDVADRDPEILADPPPDAWLMRFGDSAVDFELHAWVPDPSMTLSTTSALNMSVWRAFAEAGIEIPYPQRDLHIRSGFPPGPLTPSPEPPVSSGSQPPEAAPR